MERELKVAVDHDIYETRITNSSINVLFEKKNIVIGGAFHLIIDGQEDIIEFDPWRKHGDINAIWRLIGVNVRYFHMNSNRMSIVLDGATIVIPRISDYEHAEIWDNCQFYTYPQILWL